MPELPEVETVVRELKVLIPGKKITTIHPVWPKSYEEFSQTPLQGQKVEELGRKGKYITIKLSDSFLIIHLRMTGQLLFKPNGGQEINPHVRVVIQFSDGTALHFNDTRKFGRIYKIDNPATILNKIGIDALDPDLSSDWFVRGLKKSGMNIKALLLSQNLISGVGNIYADESLFRSKIHPESTANKIPKARMLELFRNVQVVLQSAVNNMGSTISDYRDSYGMTGNNQNFLRVYQQEGKSCVECGKSIVKIRVAGRGTHLCQKCQKKYK